MAQIIVILGLCYLCFYIVLQVNLHTPTMQSKELNDKFGLATFVFEIHYFKLYIADYTSTIPTARPYSLLYRTNLVWSSFMMT